MKNLSIHDLVRFFKMNDLPKKPIKLDKCSTVIDGKKFVDVSIATLLANPKKRTFMPYYLRLMRYAKIVNLYNEKKDLMLQQLNNK